MSNDGWITKPSPSYFRERHKRIKEERLTYVEERLGDCCVKCGANENLEFDHIDSKTKLFALSAGIERKWLDFAAEVDKCQVLCVSCHKEKSRIEQGKFKPGVLEGRPHGSFTTYKNGCRCADCKTANAVRKYEYNLNYKLGII